MPSLHEETNEEEGGQEGKQYRGSKKQERGDDNATARDERCDQRENAAKKGREDGQYIGAPGYGAGCVSPTLGGNVRGGGDHAGGQTDGGDQRQ